MMTLSARAVSVDLLSWPGIVIGVDARGQIIATNGQLDSLLGESAVGMRMLDALDTDSSGRKWERIAELRQPDRAKRWELVFRTAASLDAPRTFSAIGSDAEDVAIWLVEHPLDPRRDAMADEITSINSELANAQRTLLLEQGRLAAALRELERSNTALDEFAHAASHDLKAPLRAIIDYAELLEAEASPLLPPEQQRQLGRLKVLAMKMRGMIDAVLEYAKAGQTSGTVELLDSGAVIRDILEFLAPPPDIRFEIAADLPTVSVARVPFEQVFRNLLSNTVRYRAEVGAEVRISATDGGACWNFVVADNGPGIAPWQRDRIWKLFQTTRPKEGTGIGLAVVKRIVDSQGGKVYFESEPGAGAVFHVQWPKGPVPDPRGAA